MFKIQLSSDTTNIASDITSVAVDIQQNSDIFFNGEKIAPESYMENMTVEIEGDYIILSTGETSKEIPKSLYTRHSLYLHIIETIKKAYSRTIDYSPIVEELLTDTTATYSIEDMILNLSYEDKTVNIPLEGMETSMLRTMINHIVNEVPEETE